MKSQIAHLLLKFPVHRTKNRLAAMILGVAIVATVSGKEPDSKKEKLTAEVLMKIQQNRHNEKVLAELLPIVHCSFKPSKYEQVLVSQLRDSRTSTTQFRLVSEKVGNLLVNKVIECLPSKAVEIETPVTTCRGEVLTGRVELVSVMRSGDALLDTFINHFPDSNVSKFLVQRDEKTAEAQFKYMKISPELSSGHPVVITEPMIATGGSLDMVISILKDKGVKEENIIVASVCVAPEGLVHLNEKFPKIKVVMTSLDEKLNERKYIVPGLGDFGDRFFGTTEN